MKAFILGVAGLFSVIVLHAQHHPEPEFSNEVYYLKKEDIHAIVRLEKRVSKMEDKIKAAGFGGAESGYSLDGEKSGVQLDNGSGLSFVFSTGASPQQSNDAADSLMQANGIDPALMSMGMSGMMDPSRMISLYKTEAGKGVRKITIQKTPGMMSIGGLKVKSATKYAFSVKKIREGYWELVVDQVLPKGEYAFSVVSMDIGGMDREMIFYTFSID